MMRYIRLIRLVVGNRSFLLIASNQVGIIGRASSGACDAYLARDEGRTNANSSRRRLGKTGSSGLRQRIEESEMSQWVSGKRNREKIGSERGDGGKCRYT